jgi:eukaryotic-like serine/threonine-protein kinase
MEPDGSHWDQLADPTVSDGERAPEIERWGRSAIDPRHTGRRYGRYEIIDTLQRGGMGEVLLADRIDEDGSKTPVVLKRLLADYLADDRYVAMFLVEARVMAQLDHPNIVRLTDMPVIDGKQCLAMEYVHGQSVLQILNRCQTLGTQMPPQIALFIICGVLNGLHYAHTFVLDDGRPLELVHRDITPGNMLVSFEGDVKITDFGIAKSKISSLSTTVGIVKGTTRYLSPEQIRGDLLTPRSDLFSCATVLIEMLTGVPLFDRGNVPSTLFAIVNGQRPEIGKLLPFEAPMLAAILERSLAIDPRARFGSAKELREAIEGAIFEVGHAIDEVGLGAFISELFPEVHGPLVAFGGSERSTSGLDGHDLTYLFEIRDPIQWASEKGNLPLAVSSDLERAREALKMMAAIGARPLDAEEFSKVGGPIPPAPPIPLELPLAPIEPARQAEADLEPEPTLLSDHAPAIDEPLREPSGENLEDVWTGRPYPFSELEPPTDTGAPVQAPWRDPALERPIAPVRPPPPPPISSAGPPARPPSPSPNLAHRPIAEPEITSIERPPSTAPPHGLAPPAAPVFVAVPAAKAVVGSGSNPLVQPVIPSPGPAPMRLSRKIALFAAGVVCGIAVMRYSPIPAYLFPRPATQARSDSETPPATVADPPREEPTASPAPPPGKTSDPGPSVALEEATLELRRPKGGHVVVDGGPLTRRVPFSDLKVERGTHRLTLINGKTRKTITVTLEPGARVDLSRLLGR